MCCRCLYEFTLCTLRDICVVDAYTNLRDICVVDAYTNLRYVHYEIYVLQMLKRIYVMYTTRNMCCRCLYVFTLCTLRDIYVADAYTNLRYVHYEIYVL